MDIVRNRFVNKILKIIFLSANRRSMLTLKYFAIKEKKNALIIKDTLVILAFARFFMLRIDDKYVHIQTQYKLLWGFILC